MKPLRFAPDPGTGSPPADPAPSPTQPTPTQPTPTPPTDPTPTPSPTQPTPGGGSQMIPKDRFDEVNRQARDAARRADEAERRAQALEDEKKSDLEKATTTAEREKARADAAESKLTKTLRNTALRTAAQTAGAIDADVIVAYANENGIEISVDDPESAAKAIADIQEQKPTLFGQEAPRPQSFGVPSPGTPSNASGENEDPKLGLGRGLLAAIDARR